jgi:group I intron endonuclease
MFYYLYKITNLVNNRFYIGVHKTKNLNDGYMGSGKILKQAIQKYGIENFRKEILEFFTDSESMLKKEREIVTEDFLLREDVYNLRKGGDGGFDFINKNKLNNTADSIKRKSAAMKKYWIGKDCSGENNPFFNKNHCEETKKVMSEKRKKFFENGGQHPKGMLGKKHNEETKKHVSELLKEKGSMIGKKGLEHPCGGTKWYNDGVHHLRSESHPGEGWIEGRMFKERRKRNYETSN